MLNSVNYRGKYVAQSLDQCHWWPCIWVDLSGCYVRIGQKTFTSPNAAIQWAMDEYENARVG